MKKGAERKLGSQFEILNELNRENEGGRIDLAVAPSPSGGSPPLFEQLRKNPRQKISCSDVLQKPN